MASVKPVKKVREGEGRKPGEPDHAGLCGHGRPGRAGGGTHNLPHGLGWHAGVAVHQGLRRLREGVGNTVAEALSQARSVGGEVTVPLSLRQRQGWAALSSSSLLGPCPPPLHPCPGTPPVLDGLGLTAAVAHDLGDVLGLAPGTLVRKQRQLVDGRGRGQQHGGEDSPHQNPKHRARGRQSPRTEHRLR